MKRKIKIKNGMYDEKEYYYWDKFNTWEEALKVAKKIKMERKNTNKQRVKWFIIEETEGVIYPKKVSLLYFDRRMRI